MKTTIASLLLLIAAATSALANGTPPAPAPSSSYAPSQATAAAVVDNRNSSSSDADASSRARAAAASESSSQGGSATAAGGAATSSTGPSSSGASVSDHSSTRALGLSLPGPSVPAMLPSARDCIGTTNWSAAAPLFLGSGGSSNQGLIPECMVALQIDSLRRACQYDSANLLQAHYIGTLSGFRIEPARDRNLTDEECRARTALPPTFAPPAPGPTSSTTVIVQAPEPAAESEPAVCPVPSAAKSVRRGGHGCKKPPAQQVVR